MNALLVVPLPVTVCDGSRPHPCRISGSGGFWAIACEATGCGWTHFAATRPKAMTDAALHETLQQALEG